MDATLQSVTHRFSGVSLDESLSRVDSTRDDFSDEKHSALDGVISEAFEVYLTIEKATSLGLPSLQHRQQ